MFWWWWALAGYALGEDEGRREGLQEAKRRIDGDPADGRPVVHRKQGGPPPSPPTRSDWILATILGVLIAGTVYTLDTAFLDPLTSPGGNFTVASSTTTHDGMANFVGIWLLMRWILYLAAFIPLSQTLQRLNESQADPAGQGAKFRFTGKEGGDGQ